MKGLRLDIRSHFRYTKVYVIIYPTLQSLLWSIHAAEPREDRGWTSNNSCIKLLCRADWKHRYLAVAPGVPYKVYATQ